jgi:hypothetical protein
MSGRAARSRRNGSDPLIGRSGPRSPVPRSAAGQPIIAGHSPGPSPPAPPEGGLCRRTANGLQHRRTRGMAEVSRASRARARRRDEGAAEGGAARRRTLAPKGTASPSRALSTSTATASRGHLPVARVGGDLRPGNPRRPRRAVARVPHPLYPGWPVSASVFGPIRDDRSSCPQQPPSTRTVFAKGFPAPRGRQDRRVAPRCRRLAAEPGQAASDRTSCGAVPAPASLEAYAAAFLWLVMILRLYVPSPTTKDVTSMSYQVPEETAPSEATGVEP